MIHRFAAGVALIFLAWSGLGAEAEESAAAAEGFLARAKEAAGGIAWDTKRALHSELEVQASGLAGKAEAWEDLLTGRATTTFTLGPVSGAMGFDGEQVWTQDDSGEVHATDSLEDLETAANEAFLRALTYFFPERWPAVFEPPRQEAEGSLAFTVVAVTPRGGRKLELWFDAATLLLSRVVDKSPNRVQTTTFSDFRQVEGVKVAFAQRSSTGGSASDQKTVVSRLEFLPALEPARMERPKSRADDVTISGGASSVTLPFELANNHIYITARLNGAAPLRVIVDTGGANLLTQDAAKALGLTGEGAIEAKGGGEESATVKIARLNELALGPIILKDQVFYVFPIDYMKSVEGVAFAGLVGFEVFKRFVVTLDYAGRRLTLTRPEAFTYRGTAKPLPFTFDEHTPQIEARIDGLPGLFTLDTGSRSSLTIHGPFAAKHGLAEKYHATLLALTGWGVGGGVRSLVSRAGELSLGPEELAVKVPRPIVDLAQTKKGALADSYLAGNIGGGILKRFTVTFDYSRKLLYLEPNANFAKEEPFDRSGMWLNQVPEGYRIEDVVSGGPAELAGLKVGDVVTRWGVRLASAGNLSQLRQALRTGEPGDEVRLIYVRAGQSHEALLKLRDLI